MCSAGVASAWQREVDLNHSRLVRTPIVWGGTQHRVPARLLPLVKELALAGSAPAPSEVGVYATPRVMSSPPVLPYSSGAGSVRTVSPSTGLDPSLSVRVSFHAAAPVSCRVARCWHPRAGAREERGSHGTLPASSARDIRSGPGGRPGRTRPPRVPRPHRRPEGTRAASRSSQPPGPR